MADKMIATNGAARNGPPTHVPCTSGSVAPAATVNSQTTTLRMEPRASRMGGKGGSVFPGVCTSGNVMRETLSLPGQALSSSRSAAFAACSAMVWSARSRMSRSCRVTSRMLDGGSV
jgi:hypothetical protein